jgi:CO/xanthine dehydrogenase FAD-binding subunit
MIMDFHSPSTIDELSSLLSNNSEKKHLLAGGTDLLVQMQSQIIEPTSVIDLKNISEMMEIKEDTDGFFVGAAVPGMTIIEHQRFSKMWPGVVDGVKLIGSIQIKGRASMGGNLCNASPAADSIPAMIASDAKAIILGSKGKRDVLVEDFILGPGKNILKSDEVLVGIKFPKKNNNSSGAYLRFTPRTEMDIAVAGVGINISLGDKSQIEHAKVSIGAVAEKALVAEAAAKALIGKKVDAEIIEKFMSEVRDLARPIDDKRGTVEFRKQVIGVLAKRALHIALERINNG